MILERFKAAHLQEIELQAAQVHARGDLAYATALEQMGPAYTVRSDDGAIAICAGLSDTSIAPDYSVGWAFLSVHARKYMRTLTRMSQRALTTATRPAIATSVEAGFAAGERWLRLLGFSVCTRADQPCTVCGPDGRTYIIFERRR